MSEDLDLSSSQYEWALRSFYITYVLFEWMPILYTVLAPSTYIALCVLIWGIIASLQALATSYVSLCILRLILGISEAAFGPGVPVYLAFFYKRNELAYRIGLFISAAPLATSFASSLAWLITKLGQHSALAPWRMLFLVEGLPSVLVSVFAWYYVPDSPSEARYLSKRERRVAELRLQEDKADGDYEKEGEVQVERDSGSSEGSEVLSYSSKPSNLPYSRCCHSLSLFIAYVLFMQRRFFESSGLPSHHHPGVRTSFSTDQGLEDFGTTVTW